MRSGGSVVQVIPIVDREREKRPHGVSRGIVRVFRETGTDRYVDCGDPDEVLAVDRSSVVERGVSLDETTDRTLARIPEWPCVFGNIPFLAPRREHGIYLEPQRIEGHGFGDWIGVLLGLHAGEV